MVAVDTNVLVRYFVRDDKTLAAQAASAIAEAEPGMLLIDRVVLCELHYVLKSVYKYDKVDICTIVDSVLQDARFTVADRALVVLMFELFASEHPLSVEDAWLLALKRSGRVTDVLTFDKPLRKRL